MSSDSYAREKLSNAVHSLACSAKPIQDRLVYAFVAMHTLWFGQHRLRDPEQQRALDSLFEKMTRDKSDPVEGEGPKTLRGLSDDEASALAREIVELHSSLEFSYCYALERLAREAGANLPLDL